MKMLLFTTTALVAIGSLAVGSVPANSASRIDPPPNANLTFLCDYGFPVYNSAACLSSSCLNFNEEWQRAAVPVVGKGQSVLEIDVANKADPSSIEDGVYVSVALYSSARNRPGTKLTSASNYVQGCGRIKTPIAPTYLEKGKKYWIVESAAFPSDVSRTGSAVSAVTWLYERKRTGGALYQCSNYGCDPNKWGKLAGRRPYGRVR
jgi:hypothetical protein